MSTIFLVESAAMGQVRRDVAGIGALADPVRFELYRFVCAQSGPVSRDQAADALHIARHQAKFHLDRLEAEGLLESEYARLTGRTGPGAGRTSKLYRRTAREITVSFPQRQYELSSRLMAEAIVQSTETGEPAGEVLKRIAYDYGRVIAEGAQADGRPALEVAARLLSECGYEPRQVADELYMVNCPFRALAQEQTDLACGMNLGLITGITDALTPHGPKPRLRPQPKRCCVVLASTSN
jgi:predicted ArsR family transcriptional regulator